MEPLFHFALALLNAGAPWLAGVIVVAIALAVVGPVRLSLSIGDRASRPPQQDPHHPIAGPAPDRTYADNTAAPRLPK
jgi:hypothetical protein